MNRISGFCYDLSCAPCAPADYEKMLGFLDKSFAKPEKRWFDKYCGHIFQAVPPYTGRTFLFRKGTRIVGATGIYPISLRIGKAVLKMGGIGSVAVEPALRGRGIMSFMLTHIMKEMRRCGFDISWLGGSRFRYRNYGWDIGGRRMVINVRQRDIPRYYPQLPRITVSNRLSSDYQTLQRIYDLFETAAMRNIILWRDLSRRQGYEKTAAESWRGKAYLVFFTDQPRSVVEIQGDPLTAAALLNHHMRTKKLAQVDVQYPCTQDKLARMLFHIAEVFSVQNKGQIRIVNADTLWEKLMPEVRRRYAGYQSVRLAALLKVTKPAERNLILHRLLGFFDNLPAFPPKLKKFEFLRPLGWWMSHYDEV